MKTPEQVYYDALWIISKEYQSAEKILKRAEKDYGLTPEEALTMAYENIQEIAKMALKGKKRPK